MLIAKRHPTMKRAMHSEHVAGSYAAAVLAVLGSVLSLALYFGRTHPAAETQGAPISPEAAQIWLDSDPRAKVDETMPGAAQLAAKGRDFEGATLATDQPVYDEAAAVSITTR